MREGRYSYEEERYRHEAERYSYEEERYSYEELLLLQQQQQQQPQPAALCKQVCWRRSKGHILLTPVWKEF